ncbi:MAG: DNA-3-methyladenine glycosylase 2 family protein [Candidatus Dormiibacterota bacterium]
MPRGPFSLAAALTHAFGPRLDAEDDDCMRLAFAVDTFHETAAVALTQDGEGTVRGEVQGSDDVAAVTAQVARILSLDHDGTGWPGVGERDPILGRLQTQVPGFRPVLFYSPYEAAAWSVLYGRKTHQQVRRLRDQIAVALGDTYTVAGRSLSAFPIPARLLHVSPMPGLAAPVVERLRAVAERALEGRLDAGRLRAMEPADALAELRTLPGVGPFFSGLILLRAAGPVDAPPTDEARFRECLRQYYGVDPDNRAQVAQITERWRPYRTWATVQLRRAGYEEGLRSGRRTFGPSPGLGRTSRD